MATVCPGDFIVLCVPDQQQENSKLNPLHFTSTSQTVSRVKDLLPALSSSSSPCIVTSVMTNALQRQVGQDLRGQWQDPCHVQRQQQLRSLTFTGPKSSVEAARVEKILSYHRPTYSTSIQSFFSLLPVWTNLLSQEPCSLTASTNPQRLTVEHDMEQVTYWRF